MDSEPKASSELYMEYMVEYHKMVKAGTKRYFTKLINDLHDRDFWESING